MSNVPTSLFIVVWSVTCLLVGILTHEHKQYKIIVVMLFHRLSACFCTCCTMYPHGKCGVRLPISNQ